MYAIADKTLETLDSKLHHYNGQPGAPGGGGFVRTVRLPSSLAEEDVPLHSPYSAPPWQCKEELRHASYSISYE